MRRTRKWNNFIRGGDNVLLRLLFIALTLLISSQLLLFMTPTRMYISRVDRLEGENTFNEVPPKTETTALEKTVINNFGALRRSEQLTVRMIKPNHNKKAGITVNGKLAAVFNDGECNLAVYDGDYIEIDGTHLQEAAKFVVRVSDNKLKYPVNGLLFETNGNITAIGKVQFRNP